MFPQILRGVFSIIVTAVTKLKETELKARSCQSSSICDNCHIVAELVSYNSLVEGDRELLTMIFSVQTFRLSLLHVNHEIFSRYDGVLVGDFGPYGWKP